MTQQSVSPYKEWQDVLTDPRFSPSAGMLKDYLALTDGLESPTPYHIWSFLSLLAALCGDNIVLKHGPTGRERLNLGIILTGIPAIRKSTALTVMQKFAEGLPISYGPTDTAGQRQGIMSAMMPRWQKDQPDADSQTEIPVEGLEELANFDTDSILGKLPNPLDRRASEIYFVSKELGRLISSTSRELFDFFTDGMDGETFHYQLKNQVIKIQNPLMNIIGATTPSSLGSMMPRGGESHGFLSRLIFVHASYIAKAVAMPEGWTDSQVATRDKMHSRIHDILAVGKTELTLTPEATRTYVDLYGYMPPLQDVRLQAYTGRRAKHLLKVAALLALGRQDGTQQVISADLRLAHALLVLTELNMERAFYGLDSGLHSRALCAITELCEGSPDGMVSIQMIQSSAGYLGNKEQLNQLIDSFVTQGKMVATRQTASDNMWKMNDKADTIVIGRLRQMFYAGGTGVPEADEFRTHQVGISPNAIKGGLGV